MLLSIKIGSPDSVIMVMVVRWSMDVVVMGRRAATPQFSRQRRHSGMAGLRRKAGSQPAWATHPATSRSQGSAVSCRNGNYGLARHNGRHALFCPMNGGHNIDLLSQYYTVCGHVIGDRPVVFTVGWVGGAEIKLYSWFSLI